MTSVSSSLINCYQDYNSRRNVGIPLKIAMSLYYALRVSRSDISFSEKSKAPYLYVKVSFGEQSFRTTSVNELPPQWNETFPVTCSGNKIGLTIKLMKEGLRDTSIGSKECSFEELYREDNEDIHISLQSKLGTYSLFLCLRPSDRMKNAELTLLNLARLVLEIHPSIDGSFVENVNTIYDTAKNVAESDAFQSLTRIGYSITAFVQFGDSIADASPYLKLAWCITTAFLKMIATQTDIDKRIRELVKSLMGLFLIIEETSVFTNPSKSLRLIITDLLDFILQCNNLIQKYARKTFLVRAISQNKKAAVEDLEATLKGLKKDLMLAFSRQEIIETRIEARERVDKKEPKEHLRRLKAILQPIPVMDVEANRSRCLPDTRVDLLQMIRSWVDETSQHNIFLLTGGAGTGKSTVARTIAEEFKTQGRLGSYMFFERGKTDPYTATNSVIRTVAYNLACRNSALAKVIEEELDKDGGIDFPSTDILFETLLHRPLWSVSDEVMHKPILIILDALDECESSESQKQLATLLKKKIPTLPPNFRFLVTSRPEECIAALLSPSRTCCVHETIGHCKEDVHAFIEASMAELRDNGILKVRDDWPWEENIKTLGEAADGLFIWAATAIKFISEKGTDKLGRLISLVKDAKTLSKDLGLTKLYETVLESAIVWNDDTMRKRFSKVFALILFGKAPLTDDEIDGILGFDEGSTAVVLDCLHSLVMFKPGRPIRIHHTSLYDYLVSRDCVGKGWFIDEEKEKAHISLRCFELMEGLRFNICGLETSYKLNKDVSGLEGRVKDNIPASLLYACFHWASHLRDTPYSEDLLNQVETFAYNRLLYWIEVLSLACSLYTFSLTSLENSMTWIGDNHAPLSAFLRDAYKQLLRFIEPISQSSPHIYMTLLPLMRESSIIAKHYTKRAQTLTSVEYVGKKPRMACTALIDVGNPVFSISYSPDGKRIASGSWGYAINVWDVVSGRLLLGPLQGHSRDVTSVAYSGDGKYIVSGSEDNTLRMWNAVTGEKVHGPLAGHSRHVNSVAFSEDGKYIASGSRDRSVRLWDAESGMSVGEPLRGHSRSVENVVLAPNGCLLASGSADETIIVWDVQSRKMISDPFIVHTSSVTSLSFSPNSELVASGSEDRTICVWEASTSKVLRIFSGDGMNVVNSVAFSVDGKHILSGSRDNIVRMWDAEDSNASPKRFEGHAYWVKSVSFAPDRKHFASGSWDKTIRVWDVELEARESDSEFKGQTDAIGAIAISPQTGKFLVSGSFDKTVCVWNTESGELIKGPLEGHSNWVTSVAFSSNENHFASGSFDKSIRIWNMIDDRYVTCSGHTGWVRSVTFSPDRTRLASGSDDKSIRIWDVKNGSIIDNLFAGHTDCVQSVCYSPDGKKIVSGSGDETVRIWDASNGHLLSTLEGHLDCVESASYSPDGLFIVSGSNDKTIRVWDIETGQSACDPIIGHTVRINSVCFSPDGKWIISGSTDKTVCLWNASTGDLFFQARVASGVNSIAAFPTFDNKHIKFASGSYDGQIHIWSVSIESEGEKFCLKGDGWLTGNNGNLLMWIPPDLRRSLVYGPRNLNRRFSTSLDSSVYRGDQWTACFPSNIALD